VSGHYDETALQDYLDDPEAFPSRDALEAHGWSVTTQHQTLRLAAGPADAAVINRQAAATGLTLSSLAVHRDSLEAVFLAMTGTDDGELADARGAAARGGVRPEVVR